MAVKRRWHLDGEGWPVKHTRAWARQFAYDRPRARSMSRNIGVGASNRKPFDPGLWTPIAPAAWTDYDGVMPYGDFDLDVDEGGNGAITEKARYAGTSGAGASGAGASSFGTFGRQLLDAQGQVAETRYLLGDLIRSTNLTTDGAGAAAQTVAYTAFGEIVGDDGQGRTRIGADPPAGFPRYQYADGWGYEADLLTLGDAPTSAMPPVRLLHVGARWYQPDIGRFVMRDPIGLDGGGNSYSYVLNEPLLATDPEGLDDLFGCDWDDPITNTLAGVWRAVLGDAWLDNASDSDIVTTAMAVSVEGAVTVWAPYRAGKGIAKYGRRGAHYIAATMRKSLGRSDGARSFIVKITRNGKTHSVHHVVVNDAKIIHHDVKFKQW